MQAEEDRIILGQESGQGLELGMINLEEEEEKAAGAMWQLPFMEHMIVLSFGRSEDIEIIIWQKVFLAGCLSGHTIF